MNLALLKRHTRTSGVSERVLTYFWAALEKFSQAQRCVPCLVLQHSHPRACCFVAPLRGFRAVCGVSSSCRMPPATASACPRSPIPCCPAALRLHGRRAFLRFVWGRSRLPLSDASFKTNFTINSMSRCVRKRALSSASRLTHRRFALLAGASPTRASRLRTVRFSSFLASRVVAADCAVPCVCWHLQRAASLWTCRRTPASRRCRPSCCSRSRTARTSTRTAAGTRTAQRGWWSRCTIENHELKVCHFCRIHGTSAHHSCGKLSPYRIIHLMVTAVCCQTQGTVRKSRPALFRARFRKHTVLYALHLLVHSGFDTSETRPCVV